MKRCEYVKEKLLAQDKFGQSFSLNVDKGVQTLPSKMGTACSILLLMILAAYTGYKIDILGAKKSIDILSVVIENHFSGDYVFGAEQGLNLAIGILVPYQPIESHGVDPSYGRFKFSRMQRTANPDGSFEQTIEEIPSHVCTAEEFGLTGSNPEFFPLPPQ